MILQISLGHNAAGMAYFICPSGPFGTWVDGSVLIHQGYHSGPFGSIGCQTNQVAQSLLSSTSP